MDVRPALRRSLSLPLVTLYGLGTTIGAGIYALVGEVAGRAGMLAPLAFLLASLVAACSALSFAELCARHPRSAGEAEYVRQGFGLPGLATAVGLLVVLAGSLSAAAISNGFAGYAGELLPLPRAWAIAGLAFALTLLAGWGVRESVLVAALITLVEMIGLLLVLWGAREYAGELPERLSEFALPAQPGAWVAIAAASVLAFYAFLGFEDMVNVAEEVRSVQRTLPLAIIVTLVVTTALYFLLSLVCVLVVTPAELARSEAPLALVYARSTGHSPAVLGGIGVLAMINGALIQIIMASRVLYGLADRGAIPAPFARIHPRTRTPLLATTVVGAFVAVIALWLPLARLAETTSFITLVIFATVNLALVRLKRREPRPVGVRVFPTWVPATGFVASASVVVFEAIRALGA